MEGLISTFHIDWKLMIAQIINFLLVFCAFYLLAAKPLKKIIQERTDEINTGLLNAKQNAKLLEDTEKEYKAIITKAKNEADNIVKEARNEAIKDKTEIVEKTKLEVNAMVESGKKTLEAEKVKMLSDAKNDIVALIIDTTKKVIDGEVPPSFNDKAVKVLEKV